MKRITVSKHILILILSFPSLFYGQVESELDSLYEEILKDSKYQHSRTFIDSNLVDGNGRIIEYGTRIKGYIFNVADTSNLGKITVISEYQNNQLHGKKIQFFNYPDDTASVESYENGVLNGDFYFNHTNGQPKIKGTYRKGELVESVKLTEEGKRIEKSPYFNSNDSLFYIDGQRCHGHKQVYTHNGKLLADFYFDNGRIDSLDYYLGYGYWGKPLSKIELNYLDSTRKYINYYGPSGNIHWIYSFKILDINPYKPYLEGERIQPSVDNDKYIKHGKFITYYDDGQTVKDIGLYKNDQKMEGWKYYDSEGNQIEK